MVSKRPPTPTSKPASKAVNGPGRPKDLGKRNAILAAAKQLFTTQGFAGASMDQIAAEAGVSKLTVYSHFGDKEALFLAAVQSKCDELMPADLFQQDVSGPLSERLTTIGRGFFRLVTSEEALGTQRMLLTPGQCDDSLKRLFWEAGPKRTCDALAGMLQAACDAGELSIDDVGRASEQFFALLKGKLHERAMCGVGPQPSETEMLAHIDATVAMFLRAYAVR